MEEEKTTKLNKFIWSISGFKTDIIKTSKVDSYHASIIGTLLLVVGIYAVLAWTFFFQTVTSNPIMPVIAGVFMGFYIISFDRALIASMASGSSNIYSVAFRLILATLLGVFLAQPMILKFYEGDIKREAQILVDKKNQERKKELESQYIFDLKQLNKRKLELQNQIDNKRNSVSQAELDFKNEMDGSSGTGKWGYNTVSKRKEKIFNQHQVEFTALSNTTLPQINEVQKNIESINDKIIIDFENYKNKNTAFGTLIQAEALESLLEKDESGTLRMRYYLLGLILALIELSALIAKMLFKTKSYKSKVSFITEEETQKNENDKEISFKKLENYKNLVLESELELMKRFFKETKEVNHLAMDNLISQWKDNSDGNSKELYKMFENKLEIHNKNS